jgi:hypothetical protein
MKRGTAKNHWRKEMNTGSTKPRSDNRAGSPWASKTALRKIHSSSQGMIPTVKKIPIPFQRGVPERQGLIHFFFSDWGSFFFL